MAPGGPESALLVILDFLASPPVVGLPSLSSFRFFAGDFSLFSLVLCFTGLGAVATLVAATEAASGVLRLIPFAFRSRS